jgi:hypothetical protein
MASSNTASEGAKSRELNVRDDIFWLKIPNDAIENAAFIRVHRAVQGTKKQKRNIYTGTLHDSDYEKIGGFGRVQKKLKPEATASQSCLELTLMKEMLPSFEKQKRGGEDLSRCDIHETVQDGSDNDASKCTY